MVQGLGFRVYCLGFTVLRVRVSGFRDLETLKVCNSLVQRIEEGRDRHVCDGRHPGFARQSCVLLSVLCYAMVSVIDYHGLFGSPRQFFVVGIVCVCVCGCGCGNFLLYSLQRFCVPYIHEYMNT